MYSQDRMDSVDSDPQDRMDRPREKIGIESDRKDRTGSRCIEDSQLPDRKMHKLQTTYCISECFATVFRRHLGHILVYLVVERTVGFLEQVMLLISSNHVLHVRRAI